MVDQIKQIEDREKELSKFERQAQTLTSQKTPTRRFKAGRDVRQQQREVLRQRGIGSQALRDIRTERENLKRIKDQIKEQERLEEEFRQREMEREQTQKILDRGGRAREQEERFGTRGVRKQLERIRIAEQQQQKIDAQIPKGFVGATIEGGIGSVPIGDEIFFPESKVPIRSPNTSTEITGDIGASKVVFKTEPETETPKDKNIFQKAFARYEQAEEFVSARTTKPVFRFLEEKGITTEKVSKVTQTPFENILFGGEKGKQREDFIRASQSIDKTGVSKSIIQGREFRAGAIGGQIKDIEEKPIKQVGLFGTGFVLGAGVRVGTFGAGKVGGLIAGVKGSQIGKKIFGSVTTGVGIGTTGAFAVDTGIEIEHARGDPTLQGEIFGTASKDIALLGIGGVKGSNFGGKVIGGIRTRGTTEIPIDVIAEPSVQTGKTRFPVESPGETPLSLRKRFLEPLLPGETPGFARGFTALDTEIIATQRKVGIGKKIKLDEKLGRKTDVLTGEFIGNLETIKSEFPGEFIADRVSTAFLRGTAESGETKFFRLFEDLGGEPTITRRTLKGIETPKTDLGGQSRSTARILELERKLGGRRGIEFEKIKDITPELELGKAITPRIKGEREAIIVKGTEEIVKAKRFFVKFEGQKVPIFEKEVTNLIPEKTFFLKDDKVFRGAIKITIPSETIKTPKLNGKLGKLGNLKQKISQRLLEVESLESSAIPRSKSAFITPSRLSGLSLTRTSKLGSSAGSLSKSALSSISKISSASKLPSSVSRTSKLSRTSKITSTSGLSKITSLTGTSKLTSLISPGKTAKKRKTPGLGKFGGLGKLGKSKSISLPKQNLLITEGFLGKTFGVKRKIKRKDLRKEALREIPLGIRGTPVIVR